MSSRPPPVDIAAGLITISGQESRGECDGSLCFNHGSRLAQATAMAKKSARLIHVLLFSIGSALLAADARAQGDLIDSAVAHVGVGAGINFYRPKSDEADSSEGVVIAWRWHAFHSGWGPTFGLDWHTTDYHQPVGSADVPLGSLRTRAILAGFGHTKRLGHRFTVSGNVSGGYSFNSLTTDSAFGSAFARTGTSLVGVSVNDSGIIKPEVAIWYDVFKHVGVGVSGAYLFTRPDVTITTALGSQVRHINADTWVLTTGVTFGVWRKSTS